MSNTSSRLRARRARTEFVASQKKRLRQPQSPQPATTTTTRRKRYVAVSESGSDVEEDFSLPPPPQPLALPPPPPPAEPIFYPQQLQFVDPLTQHQPAELAKEYAVAIFQYTVKVVADAFRFCRRFFSWALGIMILWLVISMMTSQLVFFARPFCSLPIVSPMIPFCRWDAFQDPPPATHSSAGRPVHWADYPKLIDVQTRTFDQLLDENMGAKGLTTEVKKAEMAGNDLITLVRVSELKSRDQIAERLGKFVDDARGTGRSLHTLGAKIHGAIDS